ncbi:FAD-binding protein [Alphaproteobacteria bacterium GH1-50]|uniref:FAD-binding protein n=1 Tax=Kangsaoukella pontilimi TaxID=2691042 RepID=A0A7C9IEA9_9RHOB|nr:FAD-binding protein [Kangsaoukella pontilimi]MXQ06624.1 FAD-binding protein [Kangsaoukella pontilimi]
MLTPESEEELAEAIAGARGPLRVVGGGTRPIGKPVQGEVLSVAGLSGITLYEPGALTIVAKAGTPLAEVEAALAAEGQMLPFEPMDHRKLLGTTGEPTIGGVVAANVSGPRRVQAGACRDSLIGVRFVDGGGHVVKNGGRVMKNVTGYDLVKLMSGAMGTLGVLSEVSFKVLPRPAAAAALLIEGLSPDRAVAAMAAALRSPFEVSGAAHVPEGMAGDPVTMIRIEGFESSVAYRAARLQEVLEPFGQSTVERRASEGGEGVTDGWRWVRDVEGFAGKPGDVWRLSVKPGDAPEIASRAGAEGVLFDWGGGLVWLLVAEGTDLRARLGDFRGHATLVRASEETRARLDVFQPEPAPLKALAEGLRAQFDPRGILNPGLMG